MAMALAHGLRARGHEVLILCHPAARIRAQAAQAGIQSEALLFGRDLPALAAWRVRRALRRWNTDVLLTFMVQPNDLAITVPAARGLDIPIVARIGLSGRLAPDARGTTLYRAVTRFIAVSEAIAEEFRAVRPPGVADPIVIRNGTDLGRMADAMPASLGLPPGALAIGFIGRLHTEKGLLDLADAWPTIAARAPEAHLLMIGTGTHADMIKQAFDQAPRVHWLGFRSDTPSLYRALDLLVLPTHYEGFPNVIVEAMSAGVPVVSTNVPGPAEAVEHGRTGLLVPVRDHDALARAVIRLARDEDARRRFGEAAAAVARARFDIRRVIDQYDEVLREVALEMATVGLESPQTRA